MIPMPRQERLIVALDVPAASEAIALADRIGDAARFYKLGLELFSSGGYFPLVESLTRRDCRVFADLKLYDIPETVRRATANLRDSGASLLTVHGSRSILEAAAREKGSLGILAVTVLTSFGPADLAELGVARTIEELVVERARHALECGCDGVIASALEAKRLKAEFGSRLLVVTPGIRAAGAAGGDDQKRVVDAAQAFANGADCIVVGRPVRDAADPRAAALALQAVIAARFPA